MALQAVPAPSNTLSVPQSDGTIVDPGQTFNRATLRLLQEIMNRPTPAQAADAAHNAELNAQNEKREKELKALTV